MRLVSAFLLAVFTVAPQLKANTILDPSAPNNLALFNLGSAPDVSNSYGYQVFYEGIAISGNNLLLSVGDSVNATQKVWSLPLVRVNNHIVGFGNPSVYDPVLSYPGSCCVGNIMGGGLVPVGSNLLYTTQLFGFLGQHTGGNPGTDNLNINLSGSGAGGLNYVPQSFAFNGAGQLKMSATCEPGTVGCSATGDWYTVALNGTMGNYTLGSITNYTVGVTALSFDYVVPDATFTAPGIVLGDASNLRLDYYQLDANGNPCNNAVDVTCAPVQHLVISDVQVGLGVVRDPVTGDILFTTGDNQIFLLSDTEVVPEPSSIALVLGGLLLAVRRRASSRRS
jgi:hypothetical protein